MKVIGQNIGIEVKTNRGTVAFTLGLLFWLVEMCFLFFGRPVSYTTTVLPIYIGMLFAFDFYTLDGSRATALLTLALVFLGDLIVRILWLGESTEELLSMFVWLYALPFTLVITVSNIQTDRIYKDIFYASLFTLFGIILLRNGLGLYFKWSKLWQCVAQVAVTGAVYALMSARQPLKRRVVLAAVFMVPQLIYFFVIDKLGVLLVESKIFTNW